jgi:lipid-A-disaccharide synthase
MVHVGIVAGESSGDQLGGALIEELRRRCPDIKITGMAGPKMIAAGCEAIASIEELSVMGLVEVLRKYPQLRRLRERIAKFYLDQRPNVFVGIDVPDFVMGIESRLHAQNIKTIHYVAPQIWAWRKSRAKKMANQLDKLLVLFPFEEAFFRGYGIDTKFVGHPIADQIPLDRDIAGTRTRLGLEPDKCYVALMPGSRAQEWRRHVDVFLSAASLVAENNKAVAFVAGAIDANAEEFMLRRAEIVSPAIEFVVKRGRSHDILGASNVALVASGTVTMEAVFTKTPLVVAYKVASLSYFVMKKMVKVPHIAMPNVLAGREMVPEFLQSAVTADSLANEISRWLRDDEKVHDYETQCTEMHRMLRQDAASQVASEVLRLAGVRAA